MAVGHSKVNREYSVRKLAQQKLDTMSAHSGTALDTVLFI